MNDQHLFTAADILLPQNIDLEKWSVVACDQYTSEGSYWEAVTNRIGSAPSTLHMVFPEVYLESDVVKAKIASICKTMDDYLKQELFQTKKDAFIYVERTLSTGDVRRGLVGKVDLEAYDFSEISQSQIRPTEGTVESRLPPRIQIREHAPVELPHIMVLLDDPDTSVIEPLTLAAHEMEMAYTVTLGEDGGEVCGWIVTGEKARETEQALSTLFSACRERNGKAPICIAVGDGNHSLATAKVCYENIKKTMPETEWSIHPARWALVELVNVHDVGLVFEPIHRVLFEVEPEKVLNELRTVYGCVDGKQEGQTVRWVSGGQSGWLTITEPPCQIAVGSLQKFLDQYLKTHTGQIDYIHGDETLKGLAARPDAIGFLLTAMDKADLFPSVQLDGALPRKTFSMGHAQEKRFYMECRKIL